MIKNWFHLQHCQIESNQLKIDVVIWKWLNLEWNHLVLKFSIYILTQIHAHPYNDVIQIQEETVTNPSKWKAFWNWDHFCEEIANVFVAASDNVTITEMSSHFKNLFKTVMGVVPDIHHNLLLMESVEKRQLSQISIV